MAFLIHKVGSGSDILLLTPCHKSELEIITLGMDTVSARPFTFINTVESAIFSACLVVWAVLAGPGITLVAISVASLVVHPSPITIKDDLTLLSVAATRRASLVA